MSIFIPDTNYLITNSEGNQVDVSTIFNPGTSSTITNIIFLNNSIITPTYVDLSTVINAIKNEIPVADTRYEVMINNIPTDLSKIFQPKITQDTYYTITPSDYPTQQTQNGDYYYIGFKYYITTSIATIRFNQNINDINVIVVGGGGGGVQSSFLGDISRSGGGGGGGGVAYVTFNAIVGDSYNISVGQGSQVLGGGVVTSSLQTTFTSVLTPENNIVCTGGQTGINDGSGSGFALGGFGTVSGSIFTTINAGTGGNGGQSATSSSIEAKNNGGNSIMPSLTIPAGTFPYGISGGGGAGSWVENEQTGLGGTAGNGTGGFCGAASTNSGMTPIGIGCGGGGQGTSLGTGISNNTIGNNGTVLIYFKP